MFRTAKYKFDVAEVTRKLFVSYRRLFAVMIAVCIFFYILPPIFRYLFMNIPEKKGLIFYFHIYTYVLMYVYLVTL